MPQENSNAPINELFNKALSFQQQQSWDEALKTYQQLLDQSLESLGENQAAVIYHNMSIVALQKGENMKAYAWARKAHNLDSGNSVARMQFEHTAKSFTNPSIPHQISNYDQIQGIIEKVPADIIFTLTLVAIITTIWLASQVRILNRKAIIVGDRRSAKKWPVWLATVVSIMFIAMSVISFEASRKTFAIVLQDQVPIQTVPGENKTVIFEAPAGLELQVIGSHDGYFQVKHPGAFSGWVEKSKIEILSLTFRQ